MVYKPSLKDMWIFLIIVIVGGLWIIGSKVEKRNQKILSSNKNKVESILKEKGLDIYKTEFGNWYKYYIAFEDNFVSCGVVEDGKLVRDLTINDFTTDNYICQLDSWDYCCCIMVDKNKGQLSILKFGSYNSIDIEHFNTRSVVSVEQIFNGKTVYQKSTKSTIGRALVGSVLAGGVGAIIGGVTSKQSVKEKCTSLITKIQFDDIKNPTAEIIWFKDKKGLENIENLIEYSSMQKAQVLINAIIASNEEDSKVDRSNASSIADEISNLHKLMLDNIITKEEFEDQKSIILNSRKSII